MLKTLLIRVKRFIWIYDTGIKLCFVLLHGYTDPGCTCNKDGLFKIHAGYFKQFLNIRDCLLLC